MIDIYHRYINGHTTLQSKYIGTSTNDGSFEQLDLTINIDSNMINSIRQQILTPSYKCPSEFIFDDVLDHIEGLLIKLVSQFYNNDNIFWKNRYHAARFLSIHLTSEFISIIKSFYTSPNKCIATKYESLILTKKRVCMELTHNLTNNM